LSIFFKQLQTSNLELQTSNLKPQTSNLKLQTSNLKPQTSNLKLQTLSMGMSGDYQLAIEQGSNMIRVGSSIFGARL